MDVCKFLIFNIQLTLSHSLQKCVPNLNQIAKKCDF
jgi:hypothetical protein